MSYVLDRPGFSVRVDGRFVDQRTWLIHAVSAFRPRLVVDAGDDLEADGQHELMLAIAAHSRWARLLGARSVYAFVEGDGELGGLFRVATTTSNRQKARVLRRERLAVSPSKRPVRPGLAGLMERFPPVA
jgi:hypothetical protein